MTTKTILKTRRLRLRMWRRGDWRAYHAHCNTNEVMHWLGGVVTPRQVQREVDWYVQHQDRHGFSFWVIERKRDRAFVGFCGLIRVGEKASPIRGELEIGWRVRADLWRRGYAEEAATAVLNWSSENLSGKTVYARINVLNEGSAALARMLGMRQITDAGHIHPTDGMRLAVFGTRPAR